ncbi:MAG: 3-oxoacyl-ACP reductase FabG [Candidatus Nanopelagicales bacterium]|nr:3-oxoacyl-ACP reductase FabG [Candidatus Nanopelagicales bacterium]MBL6834460.1 3-oxoacyl-ACP reductase FabG [Candidatus Nanopelagicales bacterium]MCH9707018.1 3-oxoacyl-ACP reductase FabG [Actinomycetes bacterium]NKB93049.1 SDR family oxidoreductase [Candidatus Nanopelagicales bacterium]
MSTGVTVVTGGNRGIGAAIARRLVDAGHRVVVASRSGTGPDECALTGAVSMDVSSAVSIADGLSQIEETYGPIGVLIANAGITKDNLLMRMSDEEVDSVVQTNLSGSIRLCRGVARGMIRAKTGRIVLISSVVGLLGSAGQVNYAASKAGLVGVARSLARELGSRGITVNVVAPGFVETDMTAELEESRRDEILSAIPLGRYASADEVAAVVEFLVGPDAGYITGSVIPVDGGLGMGH